jgi:hypothetical protein
LFDFEQKFVSFATLKQKLNYMLKTCVTVTLCLVAFMGISQEQETQKLNSEIKTNLELTPQQQEPTPTPEEQGFKAMEVNGKIIYRKEINGIIVEFIPEEL